MTIYKLTEQFKMFFPKHVISIKSMTLNFNINILLPCFFSLFISFNLRSLQYISTKVYKLLTTKIFKKLPLSLSFFEY